MMTTPQRLFRAILTGIIVSIVWTVTSYAQTPTRADLLKTVQHIQSLAKEQQAALDNEKALHAAVEKALINATNAIAVLQKQVQDQTNKLNSTQDKLDKASKALWWYRLHWWGAWVMLGLGILACGAFAFLKFTGRLAVVASKI